MNPWLDVAVRHIFLSVFYLQSINTQVNMNSEEWVVIEYDWMERGIPLSIYCNVTEIDDTCYTNGR